MSDDETFTKLRDLIAKLRQAIEEDDLAAMDELLDQLEQTLPSD